MRRVGVGLGGLLAVVVLVWGAAEQTSADRASGDWTGEVALRGNYYWEQSTRVLAPSTGVHLEAPNGLRIDAAYLVDSITSASQAAGVIEDVRFTEIRHQGNVGLGYEFELDGGNTLDLSGGMQVSREPDYLSVGGNINAALSLDDRATVLSLGANFSSDHISQVFRAGSGTRPNPMGGTSADVFEEDFLALAFHVGWEQILGPNAYMQLSYQYGHLGGFLANAYRRVQVGDLFRAERHPRTRHRHTLTGRLAYHIPATGTSLHAIYRAYYDSWNIGALTPEFRIYQRLARGATIRLRWRHYTQTEASFYEDDYDASIAADALVTADPKMSRFHNNLLGAQFTLKLGFLQGTALGFLEEARLDFSFEYLWNTNRFGNGVISQAGFTVPF